MLDNFTNNSLRINAHGHLLPYKHQIPEFMKQKEIFWISDDNKYMCQKNWSRPVTHPSFFLAEKIAWLEKNQIDHEVLITLSQLYGNGFDRSTCFDMMRFQNDFHAEIQDQNSKIFTCGFVVQPAYIDFALKEIERCVKTLKLSVLCLPTHFLTVDQVWKSVFSPENIPLFELANELNLAVEIHPYDSEKIVQLEDQFWRFHLIWMCAQTADAYHFYSAYDFAHKFPNLRVCFAHGNQFGQVGYGRRVQAFNGRPDLFKEAVHPKENINCSNVYFDTLVHDVLSFELLVKRQGVSQIVAGLDDPYPLGEMDGIKDSYPGKVLDEAVKEGIIQLYEKNLIWSNNVLNWLGKKSLN